MLGRILTGLVLAGVAGTSMVDVGTADAAEADQAVVQRIVDGDTLDVRLGGGVTRVRLLNVDTPETVDPHRPVECLGPQASTFLNDLLPPGTPVTLGYDVERIDRYGRTLAAVFTADGTLVNSEVARQGLAATMVIGGNDRFYPQVEQARAEAMAAGRGLYSADVTCTIPAQVRAATADGPAAGPQASATELDAGAAAAADTADRTAWLERVLAVGPVGVAWTALPPAEQQRLTALIRQRHEKAERDETTARTAATAARAREADERTARETRAAREREAVPEQAQQEARDRATRKAEEKARPGTPSSKTAAPKTAAPRTAVPRTAAPRTAGPKAPPKKADPSPSSGPPGYTGPRCYAPGGKTWTPCAPKKPSSGSTAYTGPRCYAPGGKTWKPC